MIKFFRKIRYDLMEKNKTGKYLKYAIGEILLVVIGILIALSINNWNQKRLEINQEKITLSNLNEEFQDNLRDLDSINAKLSNTIANMENLFAMFNKEESQYASTTLDSIISKVLTSPTWKPSEFVLNDLKNSGGLSKLRNKELKKLLFQWTRYYYEMKEMATQTEKTSIDIVEFLKIHGSLRNVDASDSSFMYERSKLNIDNLSLLQNPQFENYIDDKLYVLQETKNMSVKAKQLINQILKETSVE
ncbi:MAG: hypothetical protein HKO01_08315 [Flaviramulus sp.]|nr:DUF6090 family protein [Flaviramulus sp.]NNC50520.1 hypothetical protein [Flaviramulus sp.]